MQPIAWTEPSSNARNLSQLRALPALSLSIVVDLHAARRASKPQITISDTAPATPAGSDRAAPPGSGGESHHGSRSENSAC